MDSQSVVLVVLALVVAVLVALMLRRGASGGQIAGRLDQMAQSQAAQQAALDARLQAQERNLTRAVEDRLGDLNKRIGDKLQESTEKAGRSLSDLASRLAVIDRAQANIMELSGQVVGLQNILSNKQARGAFGTNSSSSPVPCRAPLQCNRPYRKRAGSSAVRGRRV